MFFDWINTMIEFTLVFELYSLLSTKRAAPLQILAYFLVSALTSAYFAIWNPQILFLNLLLFMLAQFFCLRTNTIKARAVFSFVSVFIVTYLELMFCSILPVALLQTNWGNFAVVGTLLLLVSTSCFFIKRHEFDHILSQLVLKYKFLFAFLLAFSTFFGQFYLLRLSVVWTYLPGLITVFLFALSLVALATYVYHVRSTDKLTLELFQQNMKNTEDCLTAIRISNHDYKHQIQNLRDQINSADSLESLKTTFNQYIDQLNEDRKLSSALLAITNPFLRSILYGCYSRCLEKGIEFRFSSTHLLPSFPLKDHQLVDVLQNLFTNAIEYNETLSGEEQYVDVALHQQGSVHKITISTPCYQPNLSVSQILSTGFSTKGTTNHGIGLTSVQNLLKQNNISFYGENNNTTLSFVISYSEGDTQ